MAVVLQIIFILLLGITQAEEARLGYCTNLFGNLENKPRGTVKKVSDARRKERGIRHGVSERRSNNADDAFSAVPLNYVIDSSLNNKRNVILIHGLGDNLKSMETLAAKFNSDGFNVLRVDLHGHGETLNNYLKVQKNLPKVFNYKENVIDLVEIIRRENFKNPLIIGHSYGAAIAYALAKKLEKMENFRPTHIVMMAPYLQRLDKEFNNTVGWILTKKQREALLDSFMREAFSKYISDDIQIEAAIAVVKGILDFDLISGKVKLLKRKIPTLILSGANDKLIKLSYIRQFQRRLQSEEHTYEVAFIDDADHFFPRKKSAITLQEIYDFLKNNP